MRITGRILSFFAVIQDTVMPFTSQQKMLAENYTSTPESIMPNFITFALYKTLCENHTKPYIEIIQNLM